MKEYPGKWIAIINREVVDSDAESDPLKRRVYAKYAHRSIVITPVEPEQRVFGIPSRPQSSYSRLLDGGV